MAAPARGRAAGPQARPGRSPTAAALPRRSARRSVTGSAGSGSRMPTTATVAIRWAARIPARRPPMNSRSKRGGRPIWPVRWARVAPRARPVSPPPRCVNMPDPPAHGTRRTRRRPGRIAGQEGEQARDHEGDEKEAADHDGAPEAAIAERVGQMRQRHLRETCTEQVPERQPEQRLEGVRHARRNTAGRELDQ